MAKMGLPRRIPPLDFNEKDADRASLLPTCQNDNHDERDDFLSLEDQTNNRQRLSPSQRPSLRWIAATILALVLSNIVTYSLTIARTPTQTQQHCSVAIPPKGIPHALKAIPTTVNPVVLNVSFYDENDNIYRQHGSIETERAWVDLTQSKSGVILISKEDAAQADIDPAKHAYWDNPAAGLEGYPVGIEALHQVHCLNLLRQNLYYNVDFVRKNCAALGCHAEHEPEEYARYHIDHCIELLRERLMCTADIGIVPLVWLGMDGRTTGDMKREHVCRDYDAVRMFFVENAVRMPEPGVVQPKNGDYVVDDYI
ncbi:hypothetical protein B0H66DRAFT_269811 [Apodospora peruviana]|uniref:Uncharacterized protein n=1 Tax=Apodospora peruviana TaxID=516989 RepID=A0AAE0M1F1_9PEZI|nr:hypothetical protein B0H66DRAFT_269811 [Apodospora peruviana]